MSHFACFGLIMVNLVDCYILDCGNDNRLEDYANSVCVCVCQGIGFEDPNSLAHLAPTMFLKD